jgi:hypothetical protein
MSEPSTSGGKAPRASTMGWLEYVIGGAAVAISALSLWLAVGANETQERLLAASTWPYAQFSTGNRLDDGTSAITLNLHNAGVGPARVKWVTVEHGGAPRTDSVALLKACCGGSGKLVTTITSDPARVLVAGEQVTFMRFDEAAADPEVWKAFNRERFKLRVRACYCSVLDACWILDSTRREPEPVAQCPAIAEDDRWHG